MCSANCDKEFCGPEMFVCRALCWTRTRFHIAKQHFCLLFLFYMTDPGTNPAFSYLTVGGWVGKAWLSGVLVPALAELCRREMQRAVQRWW